MPNIIDTSKSVPLTPEEEWAEARKELKALKREHEEKMKEALWMTEFIRPEIMEFAFQMELTMRKNDKEKGDSWKTCDPVLLCKKLEEESEEVSNEIYQLIYQRENTLDTELLDLGCCGVMLWNRIKKNEEE